MSERSAKLASRTESQEQSQFEIDFPLSVIFLATIAAWSSLIVYSMIF